MKKIYTVFLSLLTLVFYFSIIGNSGGPNIGATGAPGEGTCANCHGGGSYGTTLSVEIMPMGGGPVVTEYVGGVTYDIVVTVNVSSGTPAGYGFQMVVLDAGGSSAGTFSNLSSTVKTLVSGGKTYVEHNQRSASNTFAFQWTAPTSLVAAGPIDFFTMGNAVNGSGTGGDSPSAPGQITMQEALLPVDLVEFTVSQEETSVVLDWTVTGDANVEEYLVERSIDNADFELIGSLLSEGNVDETEYRFYDESPISGSTNYYRLKILEDNGEYVYSEVVAVKMDRRIKGIEIQPNPILTTATMSLAVEVEGDYSLRIFNGAGQMIKSETIALDQNNTMIELSTIEWPSGVYYVELSGEQDQFVRKVVKQ